MSMTISYTFKEVTAVREASGRVRYGVVYQETGSPYGNREVRYNMTELEKALTAAHHGACSGNAMALREYTLHNDALRRVQQKKMRDMSNAMLQNPHEAVSHTVQDLTKQVLDRINRQSHLPVQAVIGLTRK